MPDREWKTISASQAPALFNQSPYITRWMLWQAFKRRDRSLIEPDMNERINWGTLLQDDILQATALQYRLDVRENHDDEFVRRGRLGATIDGRMFAPDQGKIIIEAKNVDRLEYRNKWTETGAPPHVEIQLQQQLYVDEADRGIIAVFVGGNSISWHERAPDREFHERLVAEADSFFASLEADEPPDALGSPIELPVIAAVHAEDRPGTFVDAHGEADIAHALRQYAHATSDARFAKKLREQTKARLLARLGDANELRTDGGRLYVKRIPIDAQMCEPHDEPKQLRKASIQIRLDAQLIDVEIEERF